MNIATVTSALAALFAVVGVTAIQGSHGRRRDAGVDAQSAAVTRGVTPAWNATAISGEFLTAAAFLGTAGLVLAYGADMLWMPVGATAGYVLLVALVTAPMHRSGAYTVADFLEWRLESPVVRRAVTMCVCMVGWVCLLPQFRGAGVTLRVLTGAPYWTGWAVVVVIVLVIVLWRGVRSITGVHAVQYWVKLVAVVIPTLTLIMMWRPDGRPDVADGPPRFPAGTTVRVENDLAVRVPEKLFAGVHGCLDGTRHSGEQVTIGAGRHTLRSGSRVRFTAGTAIPHIDGLPVQDAPTWATPLGGDARRLLGTYSLIICCALGTMGLPHILMRFYTSASGRDARRTAALVPMMLALFAFFPAVYGALGRIYTPELLMTGDADATVLTLPSRLLPGTSGALLTGLLVAGACAAFVSSSCGGVVSIGSTLAQCLGRGRAMDFRVGAALALGVPLALMAAPFGQMSAGRLITLGLGVSACSLCPLLLLAIWWRGLTAAGACAGLLTGSGLAVGAGVVLLPAGLLSAWPDALASWPVLAVVPVTVAVMIGVSLLTRERVPKHADRAMARMHVPEGDADE